MELTYKKCIKRHKNVIEEMVVICIARRSKCIEIDGSKSSLKQSATMMDNT